MWTVWDLSSQIKLPRLVQAFFAASGDLHLYKLSSQLAGRSTAQWTLLCQVGMINNYVIIDVAELSS